MSEPEPEWTSEQRELVKAFFLDRDMRGEHGFLMTETTSPEADPTDRDGSLRFIADKLPTIDFAQKARLDALDAYRKNYPDANLNGAIFPVHRVERPRE